MNNKYLINAGASDNNINKFINIPYVMYNANTGVVKFSGKITENSQMSVSQKGYTSGIIGTTDNQSSSNPSENKNVSLNCTVLNNTTKYIIFTNYSSKENNWNNYLVSIKTLGKNPICTLRADNWAMIGNTTAGDEYTNKITKSTTVTDWDTFVKIWMELDAN